MANVLITGADGFLGRHLSHELVRRGHAVLGAALGGPKADPPNRRFVHVTRPDALAAAVEPAVLEHGSDTVVHCAFVNRKPGDQTDEAYLEEALRRDLPLFEMCARRRLRLLLVGSSAVYGALATTTGIREEDPVRPVTLYGVAKAAQELHAGFLQAASGLDLALARLFNLCGPGQSAGMLIPDWVGRVTAIARGAPPRLVVRNRATVRDFVDVRDAARALAMVLESFTPGEVVNVASGQPVSLTELSDELQRLSPVPYDVIETDPVPSGTDALVHFGSFERLRTRYGWSPEVSWRQSLADVWQQAQTES